MAVRPQMAGQTLHVHQRGVGSCQDYARRWAAITQQQHDKQHTKRGGAGRNLCSATCRPRGATRWDAASYRNQSAGTSGRPKSDVTSRLRGRDPAPTHHIRTSTNTPSDRAHRATLMLRPRRPTRARHSPKFATIRMAGHGACMLHERSRITPRDLPHGRAASYVFAACRTNKRSVPARALGGSASGLA